MKYVKQALGGISEFDEKSPEYLALMALPVAQRPTFLAANSKELTAYFAELAAAADSQAKQTALKTEALAALQKATGLSASHMKILFGLQEDV